MNNDLISREALREDLRRFFTVEVLEGIEPKTLFAQIMHDIDNAPTVLFPLTVTLNDKVIDEDIEVLKRLMRDCKPQVVNLETAQPQGEWIPIKTRPMTEEEKQNAIEKHDVDPDDLEYPFAWHFDCKLPELKEGEQSVDVLVTTDLGFVKVTNFFIDYLGCSCFEEMDEAGEFVAWMPLPEAYKSEVQHEDS